MVQCMFVFRQQLEPHCLSFVFKFAAHKAHQNDKLNNLFLFYRYLEEWIDDYPSRISRSETETVIKRAFNMWVEVTPLTLTQTRNYNADIHIRFIEWCIYLQNWMTVQRKIEIIMTSDLKLWKYILQVCKLWSWRLKFFWWSWRSSCTCIFSNIWWWCTFWWLWAMGYRWGIIRIESTI